jgi:DNA ligase (NAD+)
MDIEGMGDETVKLLFENEFISSLADIYKLKMRAEAIAQLPGMGEKSVAALLASIEQSKSRGLARLIPAIGVRSIGNTVGKKLASKFGSWDSTRIFANAENLTSIAGFGPNLINAIVEFVNDKSIIDLFDQFFSYGVSLTHVTEEVVEPIKLKGDIVLEWKHICVTGAYEVDNKKLKREDLEAKLESSGVKIQSSVTKTTDLLLIGNKPTKAKIDKANALNKPVMTLEQMCSHLGVSPSTFVS